MLKSCPRLLRGRLWECVSLIRFERDILRGNTVGDDQTALRGWKLFASGQSAGMNWRIESKPAAGGHS